MKKVLSIVASIAFIAYLCIPDVLDSMNASFLETALVIVIGAAILFGIVSELNRTVGESNEI